MQLFNIKGQSKIQSNTKGFTVLISSDPLFKEGHVRFTKVPVI